MKQKTIEETKLRQLFKNRSNCYADTGKFENDGSYREKEVIQAMDEDCFVETLNELQAERMYSEEDVIKYSDYVLMCSAEKTFKLPLQPKEWFEKTCKI